MSSDRYNMDHIPDSWFDDISSVLDVGCGDGSALMASRHAERFKTMDYLGVDIELYSNSLLDNVIIGDILDIDFGDKMFDCVLMMHMLEHIPFNRWPDLLAKVKALARKCLIIGTPHREIDYGQHIGKNPHIVFDITLNDIIKILGPVNEAFVHVKHYHFNSDSSNIIKAHFRLFWRMIRQHPYRHNDEKLLLLWRRGARPNE